MRKMLAEMENLKSKTNDIGNVLTGFQKGMKPKDGPPLSGQRTGNSALFEDSEEDH